MNEIYYMRKVLSLAEKGCGYVSPNPMVGAILVKARRVVGSGYHQKFGDNHGEINAINDAGPLAKKSTLYINLEPCSHFGKTPPCVDKIIQSGIKEVNISHIDPNPLVFGNGIEKLKQAGIKVKIGLLGEEAKKLNESYLKFITTGKPFVILKSASSLDGKIATKTGDSKWISGTKARDYVYRLRSQVGAVLVGIGTVLKDNPYLTCRSKGMGRDPKRIVLDTNGRIPLSSNVLKDAKDFILVTTKSISKKKVEIIEKKGGEVLFARKIDGHIGLDELLEKLGKRNISSLLVEGGSEVNGSFFDNRLVDKILFFVSPKIIGGKNAYGSVSGKGILKIKEAVSLRDVSVKKIGEDYLFEGYPVW